MNYDELTLAGVDVPELLERFMNNTDLLRMVIQRFLQESTYSELAEAAGKSDIRAAESKCHALKGVCGNLSLKKIFGLLQEQLRLFRAGENDAALGMMGAISEEYEHASAHFQLWLAQQER